MRAGNMSVALFTRAWIEIAPSGLTWMSNSVALFTRAWIEIPCPSFLKCDYQVALFTRAWIEIVKAPMIPSASGSPSSRGRGLKCK